MMIWIPSVSLTLFYINVLFAKNVNESDALDALERTHGKIIHASVIFRHGERAPLVTYPTDLYPSSVWSEGPGHLTKAGKQQMYNLGKWFRTRYNETGLYHGYSYDRLLMNSSNWDRTLMSAEVFLAGLLPPNEDEMWADDGLTWQPIPVHTKPYLEEEYIGMIAVCERFALEKERVGQSPMLQNFYQQHEKLLKFVAARIGYKIPSNDIVGPIFVIGQMYDNLYVEAQNNHTLPAWTNGIFPSPLDFIYLIHFLILVYSPEMKRLEAGPLIGSLVSDMIRKRDGSFNQTFHFYSGHDNTIAALLLTLDVFNYEIPPYGSSVITELRLRGTEYIVTVLYRNETNHPPHLLTIPECGYFCTLDKFIEITKPIIPDNWKEECQVGFLEKVLNYDKTVLTAFWNVTSYVTLCLVFIYIIYFVVIALGLLAAFLMFRLVRRSPDYNKLL